MLQVLNNPIGVFFYLLLRNDYSWALLSSAERDLILRINRVFNVEREDYANPELYGTGRVAGGENWDSDSSRELTARGCALLASLRKLKPAKVLEVGPGPGFFSRAVCESPTVQSYTAVDLGGAFLEYLRPRLAAVQQRRPAFRFQLLSAEVSAETGRDYDFILVLSCVHHIPNRQDFFDQLTMRLAPGGHIFCFDPSHYLVRWQRLVQAMWRQGYLRRAFYMERNNLSTHHFCTLGEYRKIIRVNGELELVEDFYEPANRVKRWPWLVKLFPRLLSVEMGVLLRKKS